MNIEVYVVLTMQDALLALTKYWTDRGCMVVQPFNTEVGAGTLNPATILRVLGPEPWRVAYVEPSVRPDDARYGENPNRLQTHTQFQVILKPDPGNPQELYLGSLAALGIDIDAHDVRFVEDNWASPALGAWGLGWEVWLDGLEITQFTYFQQAGGTVLDPVSVEITYGMERIIMALQQVTHFRDIAYAPGLSYDEVFGQSEYEMSRYYLDEASVEANRRLFEEYAGEARRMLDARLPLPAHTYVLKCSHAFNVLDSRGAVSTTERAKSFARMRALSREVAALWQERRQELGHPLGTVEPLPRPALPEVLPAVSEPATLLLEIGTEELPVTEVSRAVDEVRRSLADKLAGTRLTHGEIRTFATPRRLVAIVDTVAPAEFDAERTVRGPRVSAAFDADGRPTKAAAGFARGQGVDVADLRRIDIDGVEYVGVVKTDVGRGAVEVLSEVLAEVVTDLRGEKNMRWNDPGLSYSRPVRWLLALLGEVEVPVAVSALLSGRTTRVHRTAPEPVVTVPGATGYAEFLAGHDIVLDRAARREQIVAGAQKLAAEVGGLIDLELEAALVEEIVDLVEKPEPILGGFDARYLELPQEILTTVMRKHQRYLPVRDAEGRLLPHFVAVANGSCDHAATRAGNEAVLRARYEDAAFFWRADLQVKPETMKAALDKLAFEERLGSMADRANRVAATAAAITGAGDMAVTGAGDTALTGVGDTAITGAGDTAVTSPGTGLLSLSDAEQGVLASAARLAKFDLASQMVIELSSLAGTMAREYARHAGEPEPVAQALYEMELPHASGGTLPATVPGAVLSLADRFELLAGLFAVGVSPSGSSDPFGLRRAALGVLAILRAMPELRQVTVSAGLAAAAAQLAAGGVEVPAEAVGDAHTFVMRRYERQLLDAGADHRLVSAVMPLADAPANADETLDELAARTGDAAFTELIVALQRVYRIVPEGTSAGYDPALLTQPAELALVGAFNGVLDAMAWRDRTLAEFADVAEALVGPVTDFFDQILVMAEEPEIRAARLGLLASIRDLAATVLDWRPLSTD
ncbi:glycine--tRNA ligase subunit beta [Nonomuraea solani]|nr:glycine--tRNA ligase subunit beta [Nonomuraea solani]